MDETHISNSDADAMLAGTGSDAAYVAANGGAGNGYVANQDPWTMADEGAVTATSTPGGTAIATTSPSWLSSFVSQVAPLANTVTTIAPLINGKPATSTPGVAPVSGNTTATGSVTAKLASAISGNMMLVIAAVAVVLFFVLGKKRRA